MDPSLQDDCFAGRQAKPFRTLPDGLLAAKDDARRCYEHAAGLLKSGDAEAALSAFEAMIRKDERHLGARLGKGLALNLLGDRNSALDVLRALTGEDEGAWPAWSTIADITPDEGERLKALDAAASALACLSKAADPRPGLLRMCADALMAARQPARAAALLSRSPGRPRDFYVRQRLARALYQQGRFTAAFREACRALSLSPSARSAVPRRDTFSPLAAAAVLTEVQAILLQSGVSSFLTGGTLLGIYRNGGLLPHDRDIDIGVMQTPDGGPDIAGILRTHPALRLPRIARPGDRYFGLQHKGIAVDIFVYDKVDGTLRCGFSKRAGDIQWAFSPFELCRLTVSDRQWVVPSNPVRYLSETYGASWRTPDRGFASAIQSPALMGSAAHARAYVAVMRAITSLLLGNCEKAAALLSQSPVQVPGPPTPSLFPQPTDGISKQDM